MTENSIDADIKVADFGLSKLIENDNAVMKTVCGTWAYCAPEVSIPIYEEMADSVSAGKSRPNEKIMIRCTCVPTNTKITVFQIHTHTHIIPTCIRTHMHTR